MTNKRENRKRPEEILKCSEESGHKIKRCKYPQGPTNSVHDAKKQTSQKDTNVQKGAGVMHRGEKKKQTMGAVGSILALARRSLTHTHARAQPLNNTRTTLTETQTLTYTHIHPQTLTDTHRHSQTLTDTHIHPQTLTDTHIHPQTLTDTHRHSHSLTDTHRHLKM